MKLKATMIESIFNDCFCFCHAKCHPNVPLPPSPHNRIRLQRNVLINVTWNTQLLPPFTHSMINIDNSHMEKVRNSHARILTIFRNRKKNFWKIPSMHILRIQPWYFQNIFFPFTTLDKPPKVNEINGTPKYLFDRKILEQFRWLALELCGSKYVNECRA